MKYSILVLSFLISTSLFSQEDSAVKFRKQFGFDANAINSLLPLDNSIGIPAPFFLHYIKFQDERQYQIYGLNIDIGGVIQDLDSDINRNSFDLGVDFKFGKGRIFDKWKGLHFHGGLNHRLSLNYTYVSVQESAEDEDDGNSLSKRSISYGLGPYVGAEYRITDKLSVYTQLSYIVRIELENEHFSSNLDPELSATDNSITVNDFFSLPRWIALFYAF